MARVSVLQIDKQYKTEYKVIQLQYFILISYSNLTLQYRLKQNYNYAYLKKFIQIFVQNFCKNSN